jgi:hypothetical protein
MPDCSTCGTRNICLATIDDHVAPDGRAREITGCNPVQFTYGRLLVDVPDYWRIKP